MGKRPNRGGRPRLAKEDQRRHTVGVRMTDSLKQAMELVAEHEGRSLSGAIELSLERYLQSSMRYGETYAAQMFGRLMAAAFSMGGERARAAKLRKGDDAPLGLALRFARLQDDWIEDPYCYESACREVIRLLAQYRPVGEVVGPNLETLDGEWRQSELQLLLSFFEQEKSKPSRRVEKHTLPSDDVLRKRTSIMAALATYVEFLARQRRNRAAAVRDLQRYFEEREKSRAKLAADATAGRDTSRAEASYEVLDRMTQEHFRTFEQEAELDKRLSEALITAARNIGIEIDVPQSGTSVLDLGAVASAGKAIKRTQTALDSVVVERVKRAPTPASHRQVKGITKSKKRAGDC